jgi:hypothetical protein
MEKKNELIFKIMRKHVPMCHLKKRIAFSIKFLVVSLHERKRHGKAAGGQFNWAVHQLFFFCKFVKNSDLIYLQFGIEEPFFRYLFHSRKSTLKMPPPPTILLLCCADADDLNSESNANVEALRRILDIDR